MASNYLKRLMPSAARTATTNSGDQRNGKHRGVRVHINATAKADTPSVVFTIQGKDNLTGDYYTILASAAVTDVGDTFLLVYPGVAAAANAAVSQVLPPHWRVLCTAADADSLTYEITAELLA